MTKVKEKSRFSFSTLNSIIVLLYIFLGGFFLTVFVIGLVSYFIIPFILLNVFLAKFYKKYKKYGLHKKTVIILRTVTIISTLFCISLPIVCIRFENSKIMYQPKKMVFSYGVRVYSEETMKRFPKNLPEKCEDYYFKTEPCMPAQDYSPTAYLSFYTDTDAIKELERNCRENDGFIPECEITYEEYFEENEEYYEGDLKIIMSGYLQKRGLPPYVYHRSSDKKQAELDKDTVIYNFTESNKYGYAFDYDSGLVVMWG